MRILMRKIRRPGSIHLGWLRAKAVAIRVVVKIRQKKQLVGKAMEIIQALTVTKMLF